MKLTIRFPLLPVVLGAMALLASVSSYAKSCWYSGGTNPDPIITMGAARPLIVGEDVVLEQGDIIVPFDDLYSKGVSIYCDIIKPLHIASGYTKPYTNYPGNQLPGLGVGYYKTNVQGIAFRAGWTHDAGGSIGIPLKYWSAGSELDRGATYTPNIHLKMELKIYQPLSVGYHLVSLAEFEAKERYGVEAYDGPETSNGALAAWFKPDNASILITAVTCNLDVPNIKMDLPNVASSDVTENGKLFGAGTEAKIRLSGCGQNINVDYKFTTAGSSPMHDNTTLLPDPNDPHSAQGVGIQLVDVNGAVHKFDEFKRFVTTTYANQSVEIPIFAKYVRLNPGVSVTSGKVHSVAAFEVYYH